MKEKLVKKNIDRKSAVDKKKNNKIIQHVMS